jgi:hypothetical protein
MKMKLDWSRTVRGSVIFPRANSTRLTLNIDDDLLDWFRKLVRQDAGGDYGDLINRALREYVENHPDGLDDTMRAVLRQPKKLNTKLLEKLRRLSASKPKKKRARRAS